MEKEMMLQAKYTLSMKNNDDLFSWFEQGIYKLSIFKTGKAQLECFVNGKHGTVNIEEYIEKDILPYFFEAELCPLCGCHKIKGYDYCLQCEEWIVDGQRKVFVEKDKTRSLTRHWHFVKQNRLITFYQNLKDSERVAVYLSKHHVARLSKWKPHCDCDYCERSHKHSYKKRKTRSTEQLKEWRKE